MGNYSAKPSLAGTVPRRPRRGVRRGLSPSADQLAGLSNSLSVTNFASFTLLGDEPKKKATFNLNIELHRRLKVAAPQNDREMVEFVEDALRQYLDQLN